MEGFAPYRGDSPALLSPPHPGKIRRISTIDGERARTIAEWESCLTRVIKWAFEIEPTCRGMADGWMADGGWRMGTDDAHSGP